MSKNNCNYQGKFRNLWKPKELIFSTKSLKQVTWKMQSPRSYTVTIFIDIWTTYTGLETEGVCRTFSWSNPCPLLSMSACTFEIVSCKNTFNIKRCGQVKQNHTRKWMHKQTGDNKIWYQNMAKFMHSLPGLILLYLVAHLVRLKVSLHEIPMLL